MFKTFIVQAYFKTGVEELSAKLEHEIKDFSERKKLTEVSRSQPSLTITPVEVIKQPDYEKTVYLLGALTVTSEFKSENVYV